MTTRPSRTSKKYKEALNLLRKNIVSGKFKKGTYLPSEYQLCELLNVSRRTVRKVLKTLDEKSIVRINPGKGTYVADVTHKADFGRIIVGFPYRHTGFLISMEAVSLLSGICKRADQENAETIICFDIRDKISELISRYISGDIHGIVLVECSDLKSIALLEKAKVPYSVANLERNYPVLASKVDFRGVGRIAAHHLAELGHRKISIITSSEKELFFYREILAGFRGGLAEEEIELKKEWIIKTTNSIEQNRKAIIKLLQNKNGPSAIFTIRDYRATACYQACRELGCKIPDDLSIISYDDITWSEAEHVGLTTIREPAEEIGEAAVDLLKEWVTTGKKPENRILNGKLVLRSSTKKFRK